MSEIITKDLVELIAVLCEEDQSRVREILTVALPLLFKELVPSMAEIAAAIDKNYDEDQYAPVFTSKGECVDSNAARAVMSLFLPDSESPSSANPNHRIRALYRLVWRSAYVQGVEDERISQEVHNGAVLPNRANPYA